MDDNTAVNALYLSPGSRVTVVSGWCGCGYPRSVFGSAVPDPFMESLRKGPNKIPLLNRHDDLYISSWLYRLRVKKILIAYRGKHKDEEMSHATENALSSGDSSRTPRTMLKHTAEWWSFVNRLRRDGLLEQSDSVPWNKSTVFVAVAGTTILLTLVGVGVYFAVSRIKKK